MKACVDCRFYRGDWGLSCHRFTKFNPIFGDQPTYPPINRLNGEVCGPDATGFQPKRTITDRLLFWR